MKADLAVILATFAASSAAVWSGCSVAVVDSSAGGSTTDTTVFACAVTMCGAAGAPGG